MITIPSKDSYYFPFYLIPFHGDILLLNLNANYKIFYCGCFWFCVCVCFVVQLIVEDEPVSLH